MGPLTKLNSQNKEKTINTDPTLMALAPDTTNSVSNAEVKSINETSELRHSALESIYEIVTSCRCLDGTIYNQIVINIAKLLDVPFVSIVKIISDFKSSILARYNNGDCDSSEITTNICKQISAALKNKNSVVQFNNSLPSDEFCNCFKDCKSANTYLGVPIISYDGSWLGVICVLDIKEHLFSYEQIQIVEIFSRYVANELEREAIQKELIQSKEMKILGVLTSGVAHEVRNPLNAIWAITEALFQEIKGDKNMAMYKEHIKTQVERLTLLMQELLDFGKPFSFSESSFVSLVSLCKQTIELWNQSNCNKQIITFINNVPNEKGLVKGDYNKLQQVIVNLLDNASQHSPLQSIITVNFSRKLSTYQIEIIDKGKGISNDNLKRIFEPFFTTRSKGTGLGLPIVSHIVTSHEGSIEISNNFPPPGITATISLPIAEESQYKQTSPNTE